jgi:hypothetical protein
MESPHTSIPHDGQTRQSRPEAPLYLAAAALRLLRSGRAPDAQLCTAHHLNGYHELIAAMWQALDTLQGEDPATIRAMMADVWHAHRDDPRYRELRAHVDALDNADTAELRATAAGNGHPPHAAAMPPCPPLPPHDAEDAELVARLAAEASPWLDRYIELSRTWAPRAYDDFHEACGLFDLSTVAARRIRIELGPGVYPSLYQALVSRTTLFAKTTAAAVALGLLRQAGLAHLLSPDDATPAAFLRALVARLPDDYADLAPERRERLLLQLAFAAQRGWFYEEFGQHLAAMMQRDGVMAAFRGILRRFDDHKEAFSHETIGRGLEDITKPYLALLATLTPADLKPFAHARSPLWGDGYFARFAFITAPLTGHTDVPYPKGRLNYPIELTKPLQAWHQRLGVPSAAALPVPDSRHQPSGRYRLVPAPLPETTYHLSDQVWDAFYRYDAGLRQLISAADQQALDGSYGRFAMKALRIAGLLASLHDDGARPSRTIQLRHWYRGRAIAERWRASLHRLVSQLEDELPGETREEAVEQRIERTLRRSGACSIRELRQLTHATYGEVNKAIELMLKVGVIVVDDERSRNTTRYRLVIEAEAGEA